MAYAQSHFDSNGKVDVVSVSTNLDTITDLHVGTASFQIEVAFERNMDTTVSPTFLFPVENPEANTLTLNTDSSGWVNLYTFIAAYDVANSSEVLDSIDLRIEAGLDKNGNTQVPFDAPDLFFIETENPVVSMFTANILNLAKADTGMACFPAKHDLFGGNGYFGFPSNLFPGGKSPDKKPGPESWQYLLDRFPFLPGRI